MFVLLLYLFFCFLPNKINGVSLNLLRHSWQRPLHDLDMVVNGHGEHRHTTNHVSWLTILLTSSALALLLQICSDLISRAVVVFALNLSWLVNSFKLIWLDLVVTVIQCAERHSTHSTEYRDVFLWSFEEHWVWRWFSIQDPPVFWLGKRKCLCDANQSVILSMLLLYLARAAVSLQIY